jgi:hypothetical protein
VLVAPVAEYAVAAWAPAASLLPEPAPDNALERLHRRFLRQLLHLPKSTAAWPLYEECGRRPWPARWLQEAAKLWSKAMAPEAPPQAALHRTLMRHNATLHLQQRCNACWAAGFVAAVRAAMPPAAAEDCVTAVRDGQPVNPAALYSAYVERCEQKAFGGVGADPRAPSCQHRGRAAYAAWWRRGDTQAQFRRESYFCQPEVTPQQGRAAARLHLGCHHQVPTHAAKLAGAQGASVPCTRCDRAGSRADEMHIFWECPAPTVAAVRERHAPFLASVEREPNRLQGLIKHADQVAATVFSLECLAAY